MFSDNKVNDENTEAEPKIKKIINDACDELNIKDSISSNSLALTTPCKRRYNLLLTKERSEILRTGELRSKEAIDQSQDLQTKEGSEILRTGELGSKEAIDQSQDIKKVAKNIVTTMLKLYKSALHAHTTATEKAALNFQSSIWKVMEKITPAGDESSSKEDEDAAKITQVRDESSSKEDENASKIKQALDESSSKEDEDAMKITQARNESSSEDRDNTKITQTDGDDLGLKEGKEAVDKYFEALIERDLKILRDMIVQDLLRKYDALKKNRLKPELT